MKIKNKIQLYKEFGFWVAFSSFCSSNIRFPMAVTRWKDRCIINWLKKNYKDIILKYKRQQNSFAEKSSSSKKIIWSIWWQGEKNAPEIVKICFASMRKNCGSHELKIITKDNYTNYINIPEHIIKKVDLGIITLTHLSDILRFYLLSRYGGLWLDATILVTKQIPEEIFDSEYYVIRHEKNFYSYGVNMDRWITFLQAGKKNNILCSFGYDFLIEYWKKQKFLIDYMLIDYAIQIAYEEFSECKNLLDSVPLNNPEVDSLRPLLNSSWDAKKFEDLMNLTTFFKLTWKHEFHKNISGKETFYGHIQKQ